MRTKVLTLIILVFNITCLSGKPEGSGKITNLPITVTNALTKTPDAPVALIISGDGGWYHFEQTIADKLAKEGIPTIGLDSRKYFWNRRTPEETASDIGGALAFYTKFWNKDKILLIGYSLGAEIMPFIVNRLPDDIRFQVKNIVLLSPDVYTDFEIHVTNMIGMKTKQNTYYTIDEIDHLDKIPTLIIFGEGEKTRVPDLLTGNSIKIRKIPGDHHYKSDTSLIIKTIKENASF
jgi:type IV secretory pathway VirJ component